MKEGYEMYWWLYTQVHSPPGQELECVNCKLLCGAVMVGISGISLIGAIKKSGFTRPALALGSVTSLILATGFGRSAFDAYKRNEFRISQQLKQEKRDGNLQKDK